MNESEIPNDDVMVVDVGSYAFALEMNAATIAQRVAVLRTLTQGTWR